MPVKPDITKNMVRAEINAQIEEYLTHGGAVANIDKGVSGRLDPKQALPSHPFSQPKTPRTAVNEVISSIEARKKPQQVNKPPRRTKPQKEMLLDDFGEPLRWQWKDEPK